MKGFRLTPKQREATQLMASHKYVHLYGGSRSGKTLAFCRAVAARAHKAPRSRHLIARFRFNHCKTSIGMDTWPKMWELCYPDQEYKLDKTDWVFTLDNGAEVWLGGLDDKQRTDKILGHEYATIYVVECSEVSFEARAKLLTRLAQSVNQVIEDERGEILYRPLELRMFSDCNPTTYAHWSGQMHVQGKDPATRAPLQNPEQYAAMQLNPEDNAENLPDGYIDSLDQLPTHLRKRFKAGEYGDINPNALFDLVTFDRWRVLGGELPDMQRVVVAVDPSGADDSEDSESDEIGIVVAGLGTDGVGYLLEDLTLRAGPATWGGVAATAYDRHRADCVVGETNYGGAMVEFTVRVASPDIAYRAVTASRGKVVRAEPIAALYEQGRVRHVGQFPDLEEELLAFSTTGYTGARSPNRADAAIWAFSELFPGLTARHGRGYQPTERIVTGYTRAGQSRRSGAQGSAGWVV